MKRISGFVFLSIVGAVLGDFSVENVNAYNYFVRIGIPEAQRIKEIEDTAPKASTNRIVGGSAAATNQFPYQAGLIIHLTENSGQALCGASLISDKLLVTAAHCWYDGQNQAWRYTVILGSILLFSGGTRVETTSVVPHPAWDPEIVRNDIAIISLPSAIEFSDSISPIRLPNGTEIENSFTGASVILSGYGKTTDFSGITSDQSLSHVTSTVLANWICGLFYPSTIRNTNICTNGLGGVGPCAGDSGGPLVAIVDSEPVLIGIASFASSLGCGIGLPAGYTRVTSFMGFINGYM